MNLSEQTLLDLLTNDYLPRDKPHFYTLNGGDDGYLTPSEMSHLYVCAALLSTVMAFISEQLWLKNKDDSQRGRAGTYADFITPFFSNELAPVSFTKDFLIAGGAEKITGILSDTLAIEAKVLSLINARSGDERRAFAVQSLKEMSNHFLHEENEQRGRPQSLGHKGLQLYRTFDHLDDIFKLNYQLDRDMAVDHLTPERLYQRAGVGVQSGYSTILLTLHHIRVSEGSTLVDLGSGYGRVGLVCGLLRPDLKVIGYEYVPHRVAVANGASAALGLQDSLRFYVQDLSLASFKIPDADVYYLYDPFTEDTYRHVLRQLVAVSKKQQITVVTKGNARSWLSEIAVQNGWPEPVSIDYGNLCIFKS